MRIEELEKEIAYRAEHLTKEQREVENISDEIKIGLISLDDMQKKLVSTQKELEAELLKNKKVQGNIDRLEKLLAQLSHDISKYTKEMEEKKERLKTYD